MTPRHTHPAYSFIYYFQPVNGVIIGEELITHDLSDGRCLCAISPDVEHQELPGDSFQSYIAIMIDRSFFEAVADDCGGFIPVYRGEVYKPHPELLGLLRCFMLAAGEYTHANRRLLDSLSVTIAHFVLKSTFPENDDSIRLYNRFEVDRAIAYMNSHFAEKITIEKLAGEVNLSAGHFSKVFKSIAGSSPIDFLNLIRLQKARHMLLHHDISLTDIALQCGFNTSSYFSYCFIERYHMTPSAYRQQFKGR
jgi:AraC-like DNA-binding protein